MNVSSVKNLNGESFSAVQDAALTDFVSSNSASWTGGGSELPESASEALNVVTSNSASWDEISAYIASSASYITSLPADLVYTGDITGKLDTTAIGTAEYDGEFVSVHTINNLPIWSNYSNWADAADRANEANWDSTNRAISALPNSATVNSMISSSITGKADTSALTAYARSYIVYELSDEIETKLDSTAFSTVSADFYTTANESGFITGVPAGTMNESAFGYDASNNITAYNGSAFKAGDEFPQSATEAINVVTGGSANWNGTTETVSSNSGAWGGSALPISAGPGIALNLVNGVLVISTAGE